MHHVVRLNLKHIFKLQLLHFSALFSIELQPANLGGNSLMMQNSSSKDRKIICTDSIKRLQA